MRTLRECVSDAEKRKVAVGHFNISDTEGFWAVVKGAQSAGTPVIIGLSEGEGDFIGLPQAVALVKSVREKGQEVYLNADHSYSFGRVKKAVDEGFDSVIFDGAKLPFGENAEETKKCVDYARSLGREVIVEGELGYIGTSSKILDEIPEGVSLENLTSPEEARDFVLKTGVDLLAPSVGNIHGMFRNLKEPRLDIGRIKEIRKVAGVPLVLHGGSGVSDEDFLSAIDAGISVIHINTEMRVAYRDALKKSLADNPDEVAPYKFAKEALEEMTELVEKRLKLFNRIK